MELYARNTLTGLVPLYPADFDEKRKLKIGQDYKVVITNPRNIGFHRKFFSLINLGYENTKLEMPASTYRKYVTMKAGYFKAYDTPKGTLIEADSISFSNMSQDEFEELYSKVIDVVIKDIGTTSEEIINQLADY